MSAPIHRETAGVFVIAATPFAEDGALDLDSTDRMVDFTLGHGADGLTVLGVMGEAPKLAGEEALTFAARVIARAPVPVVVGVSAAGIEPMRRLAHAVMERGAAGVMVAPPPGLATEPRQRAYFAQVCEALGSDVPVCLQDYPALTGVQLSVETILALTRDHPQIVMLKHEDWPGLAKLARVRTEAAPRMSILTGNSGLFLPLELARGADGAMTGFAYPEMMAQVVARHRAGDPGGAEDLFDAYLPLVRYEQQPGLGLAIRKETLRRRGAIASAAVRAPGPRMSASDHDELTRLVTRLDRRLAELGA